MCRPYGTLCPLPQCLPTAAAVGYVLPSLTGLGTGPQGLASRPIWSRSNPSTVLPSTVLRVNRRWVEERFFVVRQTSGEFLRMTISGFGSDPDRTTGVQQPDLIGSSGC